MPRVDLTVLVLDEDAAAIAHALGREGHQAIVASDAAHARSLARGSMIDGAIIQLDPNTGYGLAKDLRMHMNEPGVIIAVTGASAPATTDHAAVDLHLARPLEFPLLPGLLNFLRDRRRRTPVR